jgi:hypothetical protein
MHTCTYMCIHVRMYRCICIHAYLYICTRSGGNSRLLLPLLFLVFASHLLDTDRTFAQSCVRGTVSKLFLFVDPPHPIKLKFARPTEPHKHACADKARPRCTESRPSGAVHVLKILYSLEPAGTEWPAVLLWGTRPSGFPNVPAIWTSAPHGRPSGARGHHQTWHLRTHACQRAPALATRAQTHQCLVCGPRATEPQRLPRIQSATGCYTPLNTARVRNQS